jgi:hypothetical protein
MIRLDHAKALAVYRAAIKHWERPAILCGTIWNKGQLSTE